MKEAIKVEKSILRFRLVQIRNWALICLKDARQASLDVYKKLEDWIFVASKAEMDAIEKMVSNFLLLSNILYSAWWSKPQLKIKLRSKINF